MAQVFHRLVSFPNLKKKRKKKTAKACFFLLFFPPFFKSFSFQFTFLCSSVYMWFFCYWPTFVLCTYVLLISPTMLVTSQNQLEPVESIMARERVQLLISDTREHMWQSPHSDPQEILSIHQSMPSRYSTVLSTSPALLTGKLSAGMFSMSPFAFFSLLVEMWNSKHSL